MLVDELWVTAFVAVDLDDNRPSTLGAIGHVDGIAALEDDSEDVWRAAARALGRIGPEAKPAVAQLAASIGRTLFAGYRSEGRRRWSRKGDLTWNSGSS